MILLDTHVAIWIATNDEGLGRQSRAMAQQAFAENQLTISAISFWEIALLVSKSRFTIRKSADELHNELSEAGVIELPLTGNIAILSAQLENLHRDPADRFIAATAIAHDATLMTADERLLRWRSKLRRQNASK